MYVTYVKHVYTYCIWEETMHVSSERDSLCNNLVSRSSPVQLPFTSRSRWRHAFNVRRREMTQTRRQARTAFCPPSDFTKVPFLLSAQQLRCSHLKRLFYGCHAQGFLIPMAKPVSSSLVHDVYNFAHIILLPSLNFTRRLFPLPLSFSLSLLSFFLFPSIFSLPRFSLIVFSRAGTRTHVYISMVHFL